MATTKERLRNVRADLKVASQSLASLERAVDRNCGWMMKREIVNILASCQRCVDDVKCLEVRATLC